MIAGGEHRNSHPCLWLIQIPPPKIRQLSGRYLWKYFLITTPTAAMIIAPMLMIR